MSNPEKSSTSDPSPAPAELSSGGGWRLIIPFALLPLVIVTAAVGVFFLFGKLAENRLNARNFLEDLQSGSSHQRWQAAYELSGYLARGDVGEDREFFEETMLNILKQAKPSEPELRRYLLVGLGQIGSEKSLPLISDLAINDQDSEIQIFALWTLGRIGSPLAHSTVSALITSPDAGIRKTAAFSLGQLGNAEDVPLLHKLLQDSVPDVRWNAALALAHLGNDAGQAELRFLLDPEALRRATPKLRDSERNQMMLSAVNAVGKLRLTSAVESLQRLQQTNRDPALQNAVRTALTLIESPPSTKDSP